MSSDDIGVKTQLIAAFDAAVLFDERLSWKAKGLAAILLATGTWAGGEMVATDQLIALSTDGRDAVQAGLRELEAAGYLTRAQRTGEGGRIYWERTMHAHPVTGQPSPEKPVMVTGYLASDSGLSGDGKPGYGGQNGPRTSDGKSGYGEAAATTGDEARDGAETDGKSGYGAGALPIRADEHARARAEEELYISRTNDLDQDNTPPRSSTRSSTRSKGGSRVNHAGARERASDPSSLAKYPVTPDPVLAELAAAMLAQCGVRANLTLYPEFAFEKIRAECVRWMAEHSGPAAEHARAKNAGALLYRIRRNPYLPLTEAERTSRHFLEWRTEAEREADRAALVEEAAGVTGYLASDDEARAAAEARDRFKVVNIPGTKAQVHFDTLAPAAAPEWGEVMYALSLAGFEMEFRGTAAAPTADGSWIVYAPDERQAEHLRQRLTKQVQWKLVPITGRARSEIVVTFTADRAAYEAAAIVSGTVQAH